VTMIDLQGSERIAVIRDQYTERILCRSLKLQ